MEKHSHNSIDREITFVAGHYVRGAFSPRRAWRRISAPVLPWWRTKVAAASLVAIVLAASASVAVYYRNNTQNSPMPVEVTVTPEHPSSARFEFADKPLSEAVKEIETVYGIELTGLPDGDPEVTLTFEGTAPDLVSLINESLDSHIEIKK